MTYIAMINMPGYMPDNDEPFEGTQEEVRAYLVDMITAACDEALEVADSDDERQDINDDFVVKLKHFQAYDYCYFRNYYYGVNEK